MLHCYLKNYYMKVIIAAEHSSLILFSLDIYMFIAINILMIWKC